MVTAENPEVQKGARNYPGLFQKALTQYMEGMEKTEIEDMESLLTEWQERGPPPDVQLR